MDMIELVFDIASSAVIKEQKIAEANETDDSVRNYLRYRSAYYNHQDMDEDEREEILNNFEEENDYYRSLMGLPPYGELGLRLNKDVTEVDSDFLHEMSSLELNILNSKGILDDIIKENPDKRYLRFLRNPVPLLNAREAERFQLLTLTPPSVDQADIVKNIFRENYSKVRKYFLRTNFDPYYYENYEYYEATMINFLVMAALVESINELNMELIDFSTLSEDDIKYLFEDYGLPSDWNLPSSIANRIAASLNSLIRHKGSKQVILDITEIFGLDLIYRYYLHKTPVDNIENIPDDAPIEDKFNLDFIKVPFGEKNIHKYLINPENRTPYKDFIQDDETWSPNIQANLYESDFSLIETKYMSVEDISDIVRNTFRTTMFFEYLLNESQISQELYINHSFIDGNMSLFDSIIYLTALMVAQRGYVDHIPYDFDKVVHITGLNTDVDLQKINHELNYLINDEEISELIKEDLDLDELEDIDMREVIERYVDNMVVIERIEDLLLEINDFERYRALKTIYDSLTTIEVNKEIYGGAERFSEYLQNNSPELFNRFLELVPFYNDEDEEMTEVMREAMREEISYILNQLSETLNRHTTDRGEEQLDFIEDIRLEESDIIQRYLFDVIDFFKSHTNELRDFTTVFRIDDPFQGVNILESLEIWEDIDLHDLINKYLFKNEIAYMRASKLVSDKNLNVKEKVFIANKHNRGGFDIYEERNAH